jgi:1-acyl-sn-glycerol-3-phosphate acyltransferase
MNKLSQFILDLLGWKVTGLENLDSVRQYVLIVAPHTSNWDFPLGILVRSASGLDHVKYLGKSSLFRGLHGWFFKWLGGYPVERNSKNNLVQDCVELLKSQKQISIVMSPEGTRKKVAHFKSGFYYIAKGAQIPICPCKFDYKLKIVDFGKLVYTGNDPETEILRFEDYFKGVHGKVSKYDF